MTRRRVIHIDRIVARGPAGSHLTSDQVRSAVIRELTHRLATVHDLGRADATTMTRVISDGVVGAVGSRGGTR